MKMIQHLANVHKLSRATARRVATKKRFAPPDAVKERRSSPYIERGQLTIESYCEPTTIAPSNAMYFLCIFNDNSVNFIYYKRLRAINPELYNSYFRPVHAHK